MPIPVDTDDQDVSSFDKGLEVAELGGDVLKNVATLQEKAMVKSWFTRIDESREFDKDAYKQLALDRAYARGDSSFAVKVNVIGSFIDTWVSLLYARNPDVDALPADQVGKANLEDARLFGKTAQIVLSLQWKKARMKTQAESWVRAALTSKIGWMKITWQEREGSDPTTARAIADLVDNLANVERLQKEALEQGPGLRDYDLKREELELAIKGLRANVEKTISKGVAIDPVDMADITVSCDCPSIDRYLEAPWISHRSYPRVDAAKSTYAGLTEDDWRKASTFSQRAPVASVGKTSGTQGEFSATDANAYISKEISESGKGGFVCVEEVWDRDTNTVITLIRGVERYAIAPYNPNPGTTRFFPFFGLTFTKVDGQRWAQSLNERSQSLQDAFDRAYSAFEEHRRRIRPKIMFNGSTLADGEAKKLEGGVTTEMVALTPTNPKQDMRQLLFPVLYAPLDPGVYDTQIIMQKFELIWGLQEAMNASIAVAKTATESEIQQTGTTSRTGNKRDMLEENLSDIAQYMLEIAIQKLPADEVRTMAGPEALWPEGLSIEQLDRLATVNVRAGSSGKPNTSAQRQAWGETMPVLQSIIMQIAGLRLSSPLDIADRLEELVVETAARSGEHIDPSRFIPVAGEPVQLVDPATGALVMAYPANGPEGMGAPAPGAPGQTGPTPPPTGNPAAQGAPPPDPGLPK